MINFNKICKVYKSLSILLNIIGFSVIIISSYSFVLKISEVNKYREGIVECYYIKEINSSVFKTKKIDNLEFWGIIDYTRGEVYFDVLEDCQSRSSMYSKFWITKDIYIEIINQFINSNEELNHKQTFSALPVNLLIEKYLLVNFSCLGEIQKLTTNETSCLLNREIHGYLYPINSKHMFFKIGGFIASVELKGDFNKKSKFYMNNGFKDFHFNRVFIGYVEI